MKLINRCGRKKNVTEGVVTTNTPLNAKHKSYKSNGCSGFTILKYTTNSAVGCWWGHTAAMIRRYKLSECRRHWTAEKRRSISLSRSPKPQAKSQKFHSSKKRRTIHTTQTLILTVSLLTLTTATALPTQQSMNRFTSVIKHTWNTTFQFRKPWISFCEAREQALV